VNILPPPIFQEESRFCKDKVSQGW